jgi:hypothetical protein
VTNQAAYTLRENTGTSWILQTAQTAVATLAVHDIPHLIVGGVAVQEHGYPRMTIDVEDGVEDRRNGVQVDLLLAGKVLKRGCKVPFPQPTKTTEKLQIVGLEQLHSLKLDSSAHSPLRRLRDKTDVVELILRRKLPRDLPVAPVVLPLYIETWDALQAES